jgi:hypothetical protein
MNDVIFTGYLRLYCKVMDILGAPKRCRVCNGLLDAKYKGRNSGSVCYRCYKNMRKS